MPFVCPACQAAMHVSELTCPDCQTKIQGDFRASPIQRLHRDQLEFTEVFLRCRGNIKEVEKELKISYPTVRAKLDAIIRDMGYSQSEEESSMTEWDSSEVLTQLGSGDLSFDEALARLKKGM
jgi:hypothetical protein